MVWGHLAGGPRAVRSGAAQVVDGLARREVHQVHRLARLGGEVDVAGHHQALAERRPAAEPELGRHGAGMGVPATRERRLLAVHGERPAGDRVVLERPAHHASRGDRPAVVGETDRARIGECAHLRQLLAGLPLRDRGEEADRNVRFCRRSLAQRAHRVCIVDDGVGVRHGEDRAVATGGRGFGARGDRLLVFSARGPQVDVWIDEGRHEHQARRLDDAVSVGVEVDADLRDHAAIDAHVERRVDALDRIEDARPADDDVVDSGAPGEHHATPTAVSTATGPVVRRS